MTFVVNGGSYNPMSWNFQMATSIQLIATGNMTCTAYQTENGSPTSYHDTHANIPVGYFWHSTVPRNPYGYNEILSGSCTFPVQGNGRAVLSFSFNYVASNAGSDVIRLSRNVDTTLSFDSSLSTGR
jgi:hypothetical protein